MVRLTSENPAKIFKIANKGAIKEGYDADLVFVDMNLSKEINNDELFTKCRWSPFNGKLLKGWPVITIVRGNIIFDHGNISDIEAKEIEFIKENPFANKEVPPEEVVDDEQESS